MRDDTGGDLWDELALVGSGSIGASWSIGGTNFWNPLGWAVLTVTTIATISIIGYRIIKASKSEREYNQEVEHLKKTPSKKNKHQQGQSRKQKDKGGEKGDGRRNQKTKRYIIPK